MLQEIAPQIPPEPLLRQCEDLTLPEGKLLSVYIGRAGIFVITDEDTDSEALYAALRTLLETGRIGIYVPGSGFFTPLRGLVHSQWDEDELTERIYEWVIGETAAWDNERIEVLARRLMHQSDITRKRCTDPEGNRYVLKSGVFHPASPKSSDLLYYLTLFGGIFGLHRFYCGKILSGLLYFSTCGLMGIGWILDVLSLLLGIQKDSKKRYYMPLNHRVLKLLMLPVGIFTTVMLFSFQMGLLSSFMDAMQVLVARQVHEIDPSAVNQLEFSFNRFIDSLSR